MVQIYAKRLREARKNANNMTQLQVKNATGINNKTLSGYETGKNQPDFETLKTLCELYGVTTDWVLGHTNNPKRKLSEEERALVSKIDLDDDSFLNSSITFGDRELTVSEKQQLRDLARVLLQKDR